MEFLAPLLVFPVAVPTGVPPGAVEYRSAVYTQSIFKLAPSINAVAVPTVRPVLIRDIATKWHQSGGTEGVRGVASRKFRTLPPGKSVVHSVRLVPVGNDPKNPASTQDEYAITRVYPDGTRFDDVLSGPRGMFEHRVREKVAGVWKSRVLVAKPAFRPAGYTPLRQSCDSCHGESGSGNYSAGLVPGGDGVLSDPLDWSLIRREWKSEADIR
jgi:hypothetical protein